jgi:hypothetical protein
MDGNQSSRRKQQRRRRSPAARAAELWRPVAPLDAPRPIVPAADPTAVLRSLGEPPLQGQGVIAEHYLAAVVEQAAGLATALAAASGLLAGEDSAEGAVAEAQVNSG